MEAVAIAAEAVDDHTIVLEEVDGAQVEEEEGVVDLLESTHIVVTDFSAELQQELVKEEALDEEDQLAEGLAAFINLVRFLAAYLHLGLRECSLDERAVGRQGVGRRQPQDLGLLQRLGRRLAESQTGC